MSVHDLDLDALFQASPAGGIHEFRGQRAVILDATVFGELHRVLGQYTGMESRKILVTLGHRQGWHAAGHSRLSHCDADGSSNDALQHYRNAALSLLSLSGLVELREVPRTLPFSERVVLDRSCEAEQYLSRCGHSPTSVCWFAVGYLSGYLTHAIGALVLCAETLCVARGDAHCELSVAVSEADASQGTAPLADAACARLLRHLALEEIGVDTQDGDLDPRDLGMHSPRMRALLRDVDRVAQVDSTVLITGESGVGKERLAHRIHTRSRRAAGPFVPVNCGAIADTLWDSELFGHRRGAFTGAVADRMGLIEAANRGTLFLDEVGELPVDMQVKLLRALQEREVRRVGDPRSIRVDIRVVAATNRDLAADVAASRFRQDLYYRLHVVTFRVPPLRERPEDLAALARTLLARVSSRMGRTIAGYTPVALGRLLQYQWPGNVRELENAVERACALAARDVIDVCDLPEQLQAVKSIAVSADDIRPLREIEREYIQAVLSKLHGNKRLTAERLKIAGTTLYRKMRQYDRLH